MITNAKTDFYCLLSILPPKKIIRSIALYAMTPYKKIESKSCGSVRVNPRNFGPAAALSSSGLGAPSLLASAKRNKQIKYRNSQQTNLVCLSNI